MWGPGVVRASASRFWGWWVIVWPSRWWDRFQSRNGRMGAGPHPAFVPGQPVWRVWSGTLKPLTRTSGLADVAE